MTSPLPVAPSRLNPTTTPVRHAHPQPLSPDGSIHFSPRDDAKIYVLSADGSSLFLLNQSHPAENEEPPPYAAMHAPLSSPSPSRTAPRHIEGPSSPPPPLAFPHLQSSVSLAPLPGSANIVGYSEAGPSRSRASTLSAVTSGRRARSSDPVWQRPGLRSTHSALDRTTQPADEATPLLHEARREEWDDHGSSRGMARSILCGDIDPGEALSRFGAFKRFWAPIGAKQYWYGIIHLILLNFPFALAVWPPLLVGTLVGTALLITLPIGAVVWWLTLFIARSAARGEVRMQARFHSPLDPSFPAPVLRPIFYRLKPVLPPSSIHSGPDVEQPDEADLEYVWDKRFFRCSWAMFSDHYSYSALSYFLLIKPLITLASLIGCLVLLPVGAATIVGLPIVLRALRRWGRWQAGIALENLC